jgi:hypothetical protein
MAGWQRLAHDLVHRVGRDVRVVLDGLDPALLDAAVAPGTNTIGWLLWHLTRSHDRNMSELVGTQQLWLADGWHARFGRAADPDETGWRHTPEEVAAYRSPAPEVVDGYHRAVVALIDRYLATAPDADLDRPVTSPTLGDTLPAVRRLVGVLTEGLEHVGQAALLRGILERRTQSA